MSDAPTGCTPGDAPGWGTGRTPSRPPCTRDEGGRLTIRAALRWLHWARGAARWFNIPLSLMVEKAVEEFARERLYPEPPPRRYERATVFNEVTGEWVDQLPFDVLRRGDPGPG